VRQQPLDHQELLESCVGRAARKEYLSHAASRETGEEGVLAKCGRPRKLFNSRHSPEV